MSKIELLSNETIDKIAAGEVVERPLNVVKELIENSVDSGATSITCEIKGGGIDLIRVTDNGCGIEAKECTTAFLRHATSKLRTIFDLDTLSSLGFRGEALSSISAVSKTEMITKVRDSLLGTHVVVEGGKLTEQSEIGAPNGTTIIVRQLFYNVPARRKFLKTATTEGAMIQDIMEKFALSNPGISIQFINNGKTVISTSGNGSPRDVVYHIFGKDVYNALIPVDYCVNGLSVSGFTASADYSFSARNGELFFVNGRFVKDKIISFAIEEVYKKYLMQHRFPFCVLFIAIAPDCVDVNVHPQKLEVRFSDNEFVRESIIKALEGAFNAKELIPEVSIEAKELISYASNNERVESSAAVVKESETPATFLKTADKIENTDLVACESSKSIDDNCKDTMQEPPALKVNERKPEPFEINRRENTVYEKAPEFVQETLFEKKLISDDVIKRYRIVGQVFDTYWLITLDDDLYIVDQHAAHEKVNYENFVKAYREKDGVFSQEIMPPKVLDLTAMEAETLLRYMDIFRKAGFEIEEFGSGSFAVRGVPVDTYGVTERDFFTRLLNELCEKDFVYEPEVVLEKLASMSCKAAIKGNMQVSAPEMEELMNKLMKLENPYNCPHGRPVFIKITKYELEKKFKRIV